MKPSKEELRKRWRELRRLVNAWDPIGLLAMGAPDDEYECLLGLLLRMLEGGSSIDEIAAFLDRHIPDHFGVPGPEDTREFARKIADWRSEHPSFPQGLKSSDP